MPLQQQERTDRSDLLRLDDSSQRSLGYDHLAEPAYGFLFHAHALERDRRDRLQADGVDTDAEVRELALEAPRQGTKVVCACFSKRSVGCLPGDTAVRRTTFVWTIMQAVTHWENH
jgi:hypothetical protein